MYNDEENMKRIIANEIMNKKEEDINIENIFNVNQYLHVNKNDSEFYSKFFKTRIFKNFIIRKYLNAEKDKYDFLRFDEKILEKKVKAFFLKKSKQNFVQVKYFSFLIYIKSKTQIISWIMKFPICERINQIYTKITIK